MLRLWLLFSQSVTVLLAAYFVVATLRPGWFAGWLATHSPPPVAVAIPAPHIAPRVPTPGSFREAAARASSAVVSINISKTARPHPLAGDPWFRFFFGEQPDQTQVGLGSGVIVSDQGYVLTNNHVVENADEIEVILYDGRRTTARLIGTDPDSDLAVLRIEPDRLPAIVWGDADQLQVGDQVLAIGNPFGVGQTVTAGIVSALGRNRLGINTFENFIQTDAAINPGNSGGALVDTAGRLLGINTAIYSRSGGSMGIGFAIPASTAKSVLEAIVRDGHVTRGWIGVEPAELTQELAQAFGVESLRGVLITGVLQGGPADQAGIRPGDVLTAVGAHPVASVADLLTHIAALAPGKEYDIDVLRAGQTLRISITPAVRPKGQRTR
ncbi:S1C family serine protease [Candidatus Symbiobacter mobilis]|uniref:Trypsin-like serine protease n=1 Tax=Candidatus Symbiobacter mobilis CR TaxID=946483 RepID=U5N9F1_9BURK|nr:trypsin-like peptidase domain-containing protein [Candidatus Symbiobacter mobilis]AGX86853.1 trypsin-like serine protease [Candidatus Symbiobacter mobilis CR]